VLSILLAVFIVSLKQTAAIH